MPESLAAHGFDVVLGILTTISLASVGWITSSVIKLRGDLQSHVAVTEERKIEIDRRFTEQKSELARIERTLVSDLAEIKGNVNALTHMTITEKIHGRLEHKG